jgi:hypothetical protein
VSAALTIRCTASIATSAVELCRVAGVEGGDPERADLVGRVLQPIGVAAGEDHVGALDPCASCRGQPDTGAPADQHDVLAAELWFARAHVHHALAVAISA